MRTIFPLLIGLAAAYAWFTAALLVVGIVSGIEDGPLAIVQILTPHLALAALVLVPLAALGSSRALRFGVIATLVLFAARFGGEWWSTSPTMDGGTELQVATWNLEVGARTAAATVALLREHPADLVALQELTPQVASAIEADAALIDRYPYRALELGPGVTGVGLLSRLRITAGPLATNPVRQEARVSSPAGELVVINAHPFPADAGLFASVPLRFDPSVRNTYLQLLRDRVAELEAAGEDVLLIGDFNAAPTEPAFRRLTAGLHDAHAEVGLGPGWTWRPGRFAFLGIGLLRIDLVLSTGNLEPIGTQVACPARGDHCLLQARLRIDAP